MVSRLPVGVAAASVATRRLDELIQQRVPICLLKVDVQGLECEVLRGATRNLPSTMSAAVELDPWLLKRHRCEKQHIIKLLAYSNLSATVSQTMSERTAFAHRCGYPRCEKHKRGVRCDFDNNSERAGVSSDEAQCPHV